MGSVTCSDGDNNRKDSCLMQLAYKTKDPSVCEDVSSQSSKDSCYSSYAIRTNDSNICPKVSEQERRNNCYLTIAKKTGDENLCKEIKGTNIVGIGYDSRCLYEIASIHQKPYVCDMITDAAGCYVNVASVDNPEICEKITDQHYKDECYMNIVIDPYKCKVGGDIDCYEKGLNSYNIYCAKIEDESDRDKCYKEVSIRLKDSNICNNINYPYSKETCFLEYYEGDGISVCDDLEFVQSKAICYKKYGIVNGDVTACDKINPEYTGITKTCYLEVSEHENNVNNKKLRIEICKKIAQVFYRDSCFARIPNKTAEECKLFSKEEDANYCLANG